MRLFVSINFDTDTLQNLEVLQQELQTKGVNGYWRKTDNLHLTLKFLGEVPKQQVTAITKALKSLESSSCSFELELQGLGVFPNLSQPRILWVGFKEQPRLISLHHKIEAALEQVGFAREKRKFKPHLTLASGNVRGVNREILEEGKDFFHLVKAAQFHLMESTVQNGIRKYTVLDTFSLH